MHEEDIPAAIIISKEGKGLVSYGGFPFQISEYDEVFEDLKWIDFVKKPLEDGEILGASIVSCDKECGSQDHDNISNLCLVGRCTWDVDCSGLIVKIPSDIDTKSLVAKNMTLHFPFMISLNSKFMMLEENNSDFVPHG